MTRIVNVWTRLIFVSLLCSAGCASRHAREVRTADSGGLDATADGNGGLLQSLIQDTATASLNNWNFRKSGW
jgi:hypothetical protein